ncbi:antimicrobial peptide NK-lysin-like [Polymixia lowei]
MKTTSILLACILLTFSVWMVHGRQLVFGVDDHDQFEEETSVDAGMDQQLPGVCWACKWALNKVKKSCGRNATAEELKEKVSSVCDQIGFLKSICRRFVKKYLGTLIEELSTTDDVKTICINIKACKAKELLDLSY